MSKQNLDKLDTSKLIEFHYYINDNLNDFNLVKVLASNIDKANEIMNSKFPNSHYILLTSIGSLIEYKCLLLDSNEYHEMIFLHRLS